MATWQDLSTIYDNSVVKMKILLRSGTVIEDPDNGNLPLWKEKMKEDDTICTYSTDAYGLVVFRSQDIQEIRISEKDLAEDSCK